MRFMSSDWLVLCSVPNHMPHDFFALFCNSSSFSRQCLSFRILQKHLYWQCRKIRRGDSSKFPIHCRPLKHRSMLRNCLVMMAYWFTNTTAIGNCPELISAGQATRPCHHSLAERIRYVRVSAVAAVRAYERVSGITSANSHVCRNTS